jgi:rod shape-determining protein MreD
MKRTRRKIHPIVFALVALMFTIVWLPEPLALAKPCWILLLLFYLQIASPADFGVSMIVILGVLMDVLCPNVMGVHALAMTVPCAILSARSRRFQFFPMPQQMMWVAALSMIHQLILAALALMTGHSLSVFAAFLPVITTTLLWPWFSYSLDYWLLRASA